MKLIETIKNKLRFLKKNEYILLFWNIRRLKKQKRFLKKYSDKEAVTSMYLSRMGRRLNLDNPKYFSEKLQWLKLNYRTPEQTICADKYEVRNYLTKKGYQNLLNGIIGVWEDVDKIDLSLLPNKFVLKATHGSSMHIIVKDKSKINWFVWKKIMKIWLKQNIYIDGREWPYKDIKPHIICEDFIDANGEDLKDYKIFCFNGEPEFIQVDSERFIEHKRSFFDKKWNLQPFQLGPYRKIYNEEKPIKLDYMLQVARELSNPFYFARIDFYNVDNQLIFGEITFFPESGFMNFKPFNFELEIGKKINLSSMSLSQD